MSDVWKEIYDVNVRPRVTRGEINELVKKLQNQEDVSKDEVLRSVGLAIVSQNAEAAADNYFEIISKVAPYNKELEKELLAITLRPIYYMGVESSEGVKKWINYLLENSKIELNDTQKKWLLAVSDNKKLIDDAFTKLFELENKYL